MTEMTDFARALQRFRKLAAQGDVRGHADLATLYQSGLGVPQNYAKALRLYRLAANQGDAFAQCNLGVMYASGQGVPQNYAEAAHWYRRAADQGFAMAQHNLGFMYVNGQGVPQNHVEAVKLYRLAADQGEPNGQAKLGFMYASGLGVPQDYILAHLWLNLAAAQGDQLAAKNRDIVAPRMTPAQLAEAQKLAREWKPPASGSEYTDPSGMTATQIAEAQKLAREWKLPGTDPSSSGDDLQSPPPILQMVAARTPRQGGFMWFSSTKKVASKVMNKWLETAQIGEAAVQSGTSASLVGKSVWMDDFCFEYTGVPPMIKVCVTGTGHYLGFRGEISDDGKATVGFENGSRPGAKKLVDALCKLHPAIINSNKLGQRMIDFMHHFGTK